MGIDRAKTKLNAEKLLRAGKVSEAIRELQRLVEDNPRDTVTLNQIGQLHLRQGNKDLAVPCFLKVAELFAKDGFFTKAVASLKIVTREDPDHLPAWEMLAGLSEQQGFTREAWTAFERVAEIHGRSGNLNGVIAVQKKLLDLDPDNLKIQVQLGDNLVRSGRKDEGIRHYLKVGAKLMAHGSVREAARMYERALQLDPTNVNALESAVKTHLTHQHGDLALQLLNSLLDRSPTADAVLLLKADVLAETHHPEEAEAICRSVLAAQPDHRGAMSRLVRLLVLQHRIDEAGQSVGDWHILTGQSRLAEVEALYEEILRFSAGHVPSLQGLVSVARASGKRDRLVKALASLADSATIQGPLELGRAALQELLALAPNDPQMLEKIRAVEQKMGLHPSESLPVASPPPPPAPPAPEIRPPTQDLDIEVDDSGEGEIEIELDDLPVPTADLTASLARPTAALHASGEAEGSASTPEEAPQEEVIPEAPTRAPLTPQEADDIRDRLTEAEVFLKYGLAEKAIAELQGVLRRVPDHIHAHQKLIAIFKSQHKDDKLVRQILKLAAIFRDQGDDQTCAHLVEEARAIAPGHRAILEWDRPAEADAGSSLLDWGLRARRPSTAPSAPKAPPARAEASGSMPQEESTGAGQAEAPDTETPQPEPAATLPPTSEAQEFELSLAQELEAESGSPSDARDFSEQMEEAEFYLNQELFGEAQRALKDLESRWPDESRVEVFRQRLMAVTGAGTPDSPPSPRSGAATEPPAPANGAPRPVESPEAEEVALVAAEEPLSLPDLVKVDEGRAEPATIGRGRTRMKVSLKDLLTEEAEPSATPAPYHKKDEYYDLASELGAALDGLQAPEERLFEDDSKSPEEMSFEEVFEEFKKGVEKKVGEEDYGTHYNLGIAYKEMELMDEAVGEFQIAARSPQLFVECCSMLGICFRQKGLMELAEKWYRKGIAAPGFADEVYVGLKYDLADCLAEQGSVEEALTLFKEVNLIQPTYRDVKARIKKLS